ncbi:MAG: Xaa-Pro peptidase family protein [Chloroflexota bacterium]|nr:Xaa-Pro peptidase family protein [Chloroflexota bacterium]MDQ5864340.1 Xaa-Pro peptidase family protein [Chloroflexota bacterium]
MPDTLDLSQTPAEVVLHSERLAYARAQLRAHGLDYLVVGPSADLYYLTGIQNRPSERMAVLLLPQEAPAYIVLPAFEAPSLPPLPPDVQVVPWGESDNPARLVASLVAGPTGHPGGAHYTIGVSDRLWSVFLLRLQVELPRATFTPAGPVLSAVRQIKSPAELALLERAGAVADRVFAKIVTSAFAGRTELEVSEELAGLLKAEGVQGEIFAIVGSGPNSASPHHHAGDRVIQPGDAVVLDFGGLLQGYFCDITRTVFVGSPPDGNSEMERVYNLVYAAQEAAVRAARPGMTCEELDSVARDLFVEAGYGQYFMHRLGHGIGLDGHEPPYLVQGNPTRLEAGMSFSIEPGLYLPGRFGVRIEDIVYLTPQGAVRCNHAPRDLTVVG